MIEIPVWVAVAVGLGLPVAWALWAFASYIAERAGR